ncbi:hypothetical protein A3D80_01265 [Candidatus Roizmanbacteria bacterium RIFCSPHIGHO2_02_FULL_40_13b]|uniref:Uncharacterized protein n=1 Tax=Candidatus Roizmanbacteria bacterium RIFCSPHIGHO2_01_FULL_39_24 TaxID=1802032 RepID=A0A1F7GI80_9BACT|nr:MAG: hypothetical protein A2799_01205 [Candidatus Roizmanbacteria bacterium RIFCSPHIGHO2_01_FULL_39_24]OGK26153.1 MAG: hypothetical protein A3D80_01265 [Candidatus Roizmanbacteria bacterium RIFCSPHIGHO2_02_FULL_40_13b]OGK49130.1 MAG: hypothetical protein A3A56_00790 [Candidatus Roizmanbacteria bacterium RIFCSPLOWO2_01_FULL_40_32]
MRKKKRSKKTYNSSSKNFLIVVLLLIVAILFTGKTFLQKQESQSNNVLGLLLAKGDDDSDSSSGSDSSGSDNSGSGSSSSSGSGSSSSGSSGGSNIIPTQTKIINPTTGVRTETEVKQEEERTEIRLSEDERIKTRTKDGRTRIDITAGGIKTRFEIRDDRIVIKAEQEDGTEVELEDDAIFKIEERLATDQIKIATDEANRFIIQRGTAGAVSEFPLSIDLATNTLIINTPSGQKNVAVLPDQAVQNLLIANIVSRLGGSTVVNSFRTGETSTLAQVITLGEQNGVPIYEINGISDQKLLGIIPVTIEKTIDVSAETGGVVSTQVSFVNQMLDLLSS